MFGAFFSSARVVNWTTARASNLASFNTFFHAMLDAGIYLAPSQFEAGFVSTAHGAHEVSVTLEAAERAFAKVAAAG
jgi:glutamate-1-semialdehyde 2,1-aminomutase